MSEHQLRHPGALTALEDLPKTTITVDGIPVTVTACRWHELPWGEHLYHFEFRSPLEPPRPIPMSETGYRSHFVYGNQLEGFASLLDAAKTIARNMVASERGDGDADQGSLFDALDRTLPSNLNAQIEAGSPP